MGDDLDASHSRSRTRAPVAEEGEEEEASLSNDELRIAANVLQQLTYLTTPNRRVEAAKAKLEE